MPKHRHVQRETYRDLTYEEAFPALPTDLLKLIHAAKEEAGMEPERHPSPTEWEAMGKRSRIAYLRRRDRELPKLIRQEEARQTELETELRSALPATTEGND